VPEPPRSGPAGPARAPSTTVRPSAARKVAQIPPNPAIRGGFVPQGPLGDTYPEHPSESSGASELLFATAPHEHHGARPSLARSRALPAPDILANQRGGRRLSSSAHHSPKHRTASRTPPAARRYLTADDRPRYPATNPSPRPGDTMGGGMNEEGPNTSCAAGLGARTDTPVEREIVPTRFAQRLCF
jgi:hypothetical protein